MQHERGHRAATNDLDAQIYERQEEGENPARGDRVEESRGRRGAAAAAAAIVHVLVLFLVELEMRSDVRASAAPPRYPAARPCAAVFRATSTPRRRSRPVRRRASALRASPTPGVEVARLAAAPTVKDRGRGGVNRAHARARHSPGRRQPRRSLHARPRRTRRRREFTIMNGAPPAPAPTVFDGNLASAPRDSARVRLRASSAWRCSRCDEGKLDFTSSHAVSFA